MVAINAARAAARKAIEDAYYEGTCTVVEYQEITDETTKITREEEIAIIEDQPCKLSFEKLNAAVQTETAAAITQGVKLFVAPEIKVKSGSKIIVNWCGETHEYSCSGKPAIYPTHQEIQLELFRGWA